MKKQDIENELKSLTIGWTRVIGGEVVTRHSETTWELDTLHRKFSYLTETVNKIYRRRQEGA